MTHYLMRLKQFLISLALGVAFVAALLALLEIAPVSAASTWPTGFISEPVVSDLVQPTAIDWTPDGTIMFIALKYGQVLAFREKQGTLTTFIDLSEQVNTYWDRGLLGLAVDPGFPITPYVYLMYTLDPPGLPGMPGQADGPDGGGERVSRLIRVSAFLTDTTVADPGSTVVLLGQNSTLANIGDPADEGGIGGASSCDDNGIPMTDCLPSDSPSHSVGSIRFGTDGSLYVSHGDGASFGDYDARALRAQDLDSLGGKVLRIDPLTGEGLPGNPFYNGDPASNRSKVWSYGFRNPFRMVLDPATGQPFIGDVGWDSWEEVNVGEGKNFGWPCYEGNNTGSLQSGYAYYTPTQAACAALYAQGTQAVQAPLYSYGHLGEGAAVVVGAFYTGAATTYPPTYWDSLFIADYDQDWIRYLAFDQAGHATIHDFAQDVSAETSATAGPVQLAIGPDMNLYYVVFDPFGDSEIRRIRYVSNGNTPPTARASATPTSGLGPLTVSFSGAGSTDPDQDIATLSYEWSFGDTVTAAGISAIHTYTVSGVYTALLTVADAQGASDRDSIRIAVGNSSPAATITTPTAGTTYRVGDTISFSGKGEDAQDGQLPDQNLEWEVLLHHNEHVHPAFFKVTGAGASLIAPDHGDHTWLRICLKVTDSGGLQATTCRDVLPDTVTYTFDTYPSGLQLLYGSVSYTAPFTVETIVNARRQIIAPQKQGELGFVCWSDGGEPGHTIVVGSSPRTYIADYRWFAWLPFAAVSR